MGSKMMADVYSGFDEYDHAYDTKHLDGDAYFQEAISRSTHGRRPMSRSTVASRMGTASRRVGTGVKVEDSNRPLTAVTAVGYSSYANRVMARDANAAKEKVDESVDGKIAEAEEKVMELVKESVILASGGKNKAALEKAKEAGRRERAIVKLREDKNKTEHLSIDLTFSVLFNLAQQYDKNNLSTEALNSYTLITKNKMFASAGRLKLNIGNIHLRRKEYTKAIKNYRMALDVVPSVQKVLRVAILKNMALAFCQCGRYEDAVVALEECLEERPDTRAAFNLILTLYCLQDTDKLREAFIRLLEVPLPVDDLKDSDDARFSKLSNEDELRTYIRAKRLEHERAILSAAKVIAPTLSDETSSGHEWCIEMMKQSAFSYLASEFEMNKAIHLMREGRLDAAASALNAFSNSQPKTAAASYANIAILEYMKGTSGLEDASRLVETCLSLDRYNTSAHVMAGLISFEHGQVDNAVVCMHEALDHDALSVQALYNLGLIHKRAHRMETALECFYKLNNMLRNNVQVLCQLASIYEFMEDEGQALELYSQANSLAPSDSAILARLAHIYDSEGDKNQAFQCLYDSYRYLPSNMAVLEWIAAYYLEAQFAEKSIAYFEKAAIMEPDEIKWHMMIASCNRRAGNYHKAFQLYKAIHTRFPSNIECLKFLVRITEDMKMPEAKEYKERLERAERVAQLRMQRKTDSAQGKNGSAASAQSLPMPLNERAPNGEYRQLSAQLNDHTEYSSTAANINSADFSYSDHIGKLQRPKTGMKRSGDREDSFDDLDDSFLPA